METGEVAALIGSFAAMLTILFAIWKGAKSAAKNEILAEAAQTTIAEKDKELDKLRRLLGSQTSMEVEPW